MKKKITAEKDLQNNTISFYLVIPKHGRILLTVTEFSKGVYSFFENTRSYSEVAGFRGWGKNPRLDNIIERMPALVKYGTSELLDEKPAEARRRTAVSRRGKEYSYDYSYIDAA